MMNCIKEKKIMMFHDYPIFFFVLLKKKTKNLQI